MWPSPRHHFASLAHLCVHVCESVLFVCVDLAGGLTGSVELRAGSLVVDIAVWFSQGPHAALTWLVCTPTEAHDLWLKGSEV